MIGIIKRKPRYLAALILVLIAAVFVVVNSFVLYSPLWDSVRFIVFLAAFMLPGLALVKLPGVGKTPLISLVSAFALSLGVLFALYLLFSLFGMAEYIFLIAIIMPVSGVAGLYLLRKRPFTTEQDTGELAVALILSMAALFIVVLSLTAGNLTPDITGPREYHVDLLNSVGLVDSAVRGFPFGDVKAAGVGYRYHALAFSFLAVMKTFTGASNFDLITRYSLTVFTPFAVSALMALTKQIASRNIFLPAVFINLFIVCPFDNYLLYYAYQDTLGFMLSAGLAALSVGYFIRIRDGGDRALSPDLILACLTLVLSAAAKGPMAAVYLVGFGFCLLMNLFRGERFRSVFIRGMFLLIGFILIYLMIYGTGAAGQVIWYPGRFVRDSGIYSILSRNFGINNVLPSVITYQLAACCFMTVGFILSVWLTAGKFKEGRTFAGFITGAGLTGILLTHLTHQYGGSEVYFVLAAYPFSVIGIYYAVLHFNRLAAKRKLLPLVIIIAALAICLIVSIKPAAAFFSQRIYEAGKYLEGSPARIDDDYKLMAVEYKRDYLITEAEYQALLWLRENTGKDAVIVTDRVLINSKYMYSTAFSERVFYLDGYIYITSYDEQSPLYEEIMLRVDNIRELYEGDSEAAMSLLREDGVSCILLSKWQHPNTGFDLPVVFENEDAAIYLIA